MATNNLSSRLSLSPEERLKQDMKSSIDYFNGNLSLLLIKEQEFKKLFDLPSGTLKTGGAYSAELLKYPSFRAFKQEAYDAGEKLASAGKTNNPYFNKIAQSYGEVQALESLAKKLDYMADSKNGASKGRATNISIVIEAQRAVINEANRILEDLANPARASLIVTSTNLLYFEKFDKLKNRAEEYIKGILAWERGYTSNKDSVKEAKNLEKEFYDKLSKLGEAYESFKETPKSPPPPPPRRLPPELLKKSVVNRTRPAPPPPPPKPRRR